MSLKEIRTPDQSVNKISRYLYTLVGDPFHRLTPHLPPNLRYLRNTDLEPNLQQQDVIEILGFPPGSHKVEEARFSLRCSPRSLNEIVTAGIKVDSVGCPHLYDARWQYGELTLVQIASNSDRVAGQIGQIQPHFPGMSNARVTQGMIDALVGANSGMSLRAHVGYQLWGHPGLLFVDRLYQDISANNREEAVILGLGQGKLTLPRSL